MSEDGFRAAVAAGVIGADDAYGSLLRSIVEVARAIFSAQRSSIFLLDEEADELVFEALAGEEEQGLIGTRIPSSTGIAGWTLVTRQPLVIEDLTQDPRHSQGGRREDRLRAEGDHVGAAARRGARARRAPGARPAAAPGLLAAGDGAARACSRTRRRSRSTCSSARGARRPRSSRAAATSPSSRASPRRSTRWRRIAASRRSRCSTRWRTCSSNEKGARWAPFETRSDRRLFDLSRPARPARTWWPSTSAVLDCSLVEDVTLDVVLGLLVLARVCSVCSSSLTVVLLSLLGLFTFNQLDVLRLLNLPLFL